LSQDPLIWKVRAFNNCPFDPRHEGSADGKLAQGTRCSLEKIF